MNIFSTRLKMLREQKSVTQVETAKACGMAERAYQRLEANHKPNYDNLLAIADYFDVSLDYLVGRSDDPSRR